MSLQTFPVSHAGQDAVYGQYNLHGKEQGSDVSSRAILPTIQLW